AAGDHDRLVVAADAARGIALRVLLESPEVAADRWPAELVVERGSSDRALDHDVERGSDPPGLAEVHFPRTPISRNAQVRHREPGQARLRLRAAAGGSLVPDFPSGSGRRPREG